MEWWSGGVMERRKRETPNSKFQPPENLQTPITKIGTVRFLDIDYWCFSGAWRPARESFRSWDLDLNEGPLAHLESAFRSQAHDSNLKASSKRCLGPSRTGIFARHDKSDSFFASIRVIRVIRGLISFSQIGKLGLAMRSVFLLGSRSGFAAEDVFQALAEFIESGWGRLWLGFGRMRARVHVEGHRGGRLRTDGNGLAPLRHVRQLGGELLVA